MAVAPKGVGTDERTAQRAVDSYIRHVEYREVSILFRTACGPPTHTMTNLAKPVIGMHWQRPYSKSLELVSEGSEDLLWHNVKAFAAACNGCAAYASNGRIPLCGKFL